MSTRVTDADIRKALENELDACAQFLIELAFLLPKGTDVMQHPVSKKLIAYVRAVQKTQELKTCQSLNSTK